MAKIKTKIKISCAEDATNYLRPKFKHLKTQESFMVALLDTKHQVIKTVTVALGTINSVEVHPRDVFREAIKHNAFAILVAHNHPSGELETSMEDKAITDRLAKAGELLDIAVLDHLIITENEYLSLMK